MGMTLFRSCVILFAAMVTATVSVAQSPTPGTYRLLLCAAACSEADSTQALAVATIVIADESMAATAAWKSAMSELGARQLKEQSGPMDNACFNIEQRSKSVGSEELFFGIRRNGSTHWQRTDGAGYAMRVYQSPDASYVLQWSGTGDRISGEGWSRGWWAESRPHRNAFFFAKLSGAPTADACK